MLGEDGGMFLQENLSLQCARSPWLVELKVELREGLGWGVLAEVAAF